MKLAALAATGVALIVMLWVAPTRAALKPDPVSRTLTAYLHSHRLPLVQAQVFTDVYGFRTLVLYGFVATEFGKSDAEIVSRRFLKDRSLVIHNRIRVRPELLASPAPRSRSAPAVAANGGPQGPPNAPVPEAINGQAEAEQALGDVQQYEEQQENQAALLGPVIIFGPSVGPMMPMLPPGGVFPPPPVFVPRVPPFFYSPPAPSPYYRYYRAPVMGGRPLVMPAPGPPIVVTAPPIFVPPPAYTGRALPLPGQLPPGYAPGPIYAPATSFPLPRAGGFGFGVGIHR